MNIDAIASDYLGRVRLRLTKENSQLLHYVVYDQRRLPANPLPIISLQLTLGLVIAAVVMNPISKIHLPREAWMFLDVLLIAMLGWALYLLREENDGRRPHVSLTGSVCRLEAHQPKMDFYPTTSKPPTLGAYTGTFGAHFPFITC